MTPFVNERTELMTESIQSTGAQPHERSLKVGLWRTRAAGFPP
jgi:hypothetical protein